MSGEHDTLDQIIAKAMEDAQRRQPRMGESIIGMFTAAVRDALLAEGQIVQHTDWGNQTLLVVPLGGVSKDATP